MSSPAPDGPQRPVITVDPARCVNCHRCLTVCPVKYCNDASGDHVDVRAELCVGCGACLAACTHGAREVAQDLPQVLADLAGGAPYCALIAPAAAAAFGDQLLNVNGWLQSLGVAACFDVSFGAELTVRSYLDHLDHDPPVCTIAQACPVVVTYIELYCPELLPYLAPVHSPMAHLARVIPESWPQYRGHRLLAVSPCAAKGRELGDLDPPVANITFEAIEAHLAARGQTLADFPPVPFLNPPAERAVAFSSPGGLVQALVRDRPGLAGVTRTIDGPEVFAYLDDLALAIEAGHAPALVDVLNCSLGCNGGPASGHRGHMHRDRLEAPVRRRREQAMAGQRPGEVQATIDAHWRGGLFRRGYRDRRDTVLTRCQVADDDLALAMQRLGKTALEDERNCATCGYGTCRGMARAIALGLNQPENCLFYLRDELGNNIFDTLHAGLAIVDPATHRIERVNPKLAELIGAPAESIVGQSCHDVICASEHGQCPITDLGLDVQANECDLIDAQGNRLPVIKSVARFESHGRPMLIETVTSLVERKQLEDELAAAAAQARELAAAAQRANAAKSTFLANMSHELRTPLNGILGVVELLRGTPLTSDQLQYLETMSVCGDHLLGLIAEVIDFARVEAGKIVLEVDDLDLHALVAEAATMVEEQAAAKGLTLVAGVAPNVPAHVRGDGRRLRQVLINFLGNAVKFTATGAVTLTVGVTERRGGEVTVEVRVRDTGIGIAAEDQATVFEAFQQVDDSRTRRFEGSGLGLAICKQLVELMSGSIGVQSDLGQGSTFWFSVPLALPADAAGLVVSPQANAARGDLPGGLRVLVVEDNQVNQLVAVRLLTRGLGLEAVAVDNGAEAVDILRREDFDVVFMDCHMPVMDGHAATRAIRDPATGVRQPQVPIIAMTANAVQGARQECLAVGMDDYLSKPVNAAVLRDAMCRALAPACAHA